MKNKLNKTMEHVTDAYFAILCTFFLFAVPAEGYIHLFSVKYGWFLCICGGYILTSLAIYLETWGISQALENIKRVMNLTSWKENPIFGFLFIYLFFTIISAFFSPYSGILLGKFRHDGVLTIMIYVISTILVMYYYRPKPWHLFLLGGSITIFCLLGALQLLALNPLNLYPEPFNFFDAGLAYDGVYWSSVGNVNLCAVVLTAGVAIFSVVFIKNNEKIAYLSLIPLVLCGFSAFAVKSDSSILTIALGLLCILPFTVENLGQLWRWVGVCGLCLTVGLFGYAPSLGLSPLYVLPLALSLFFLSRSPNHIPLGKILVLPVILGPFLAFLVLYLVPFSGGTLYEIHEILHGRVDLAFGSGRVYLWHGVWERILENPWTGGGPDTLGYRDFYFAEYYDEEKTKIIASSVVPIDMAHNEWLNIWVNQGFFALIAYLGMLSSSFFTLLKNKKHLPTLLSGSVVLFYQIQAQFGITMLITAPYFWLAVGILHQNTIKCLVNKKKTPQP